MPKKCGLSISFQWENKRVAYTHIHAISFFLKTPIRILLYDLNKNLIKILYVSPLTYI